VGRTRPEPVIPSEARDLLLSTDWLASKFSKKQIPRFARDDRPLASQALAGLCSRMPLTTGSSHLIMPV